MGVWDWVMEFDRRVRAEGDAERIRLVELFDEASDYDEVDPARQVALLDEGRKLAGELGEAGWQVLFDHWRLQAILNGLGDYRLGMEQSVKAAVEARKPQYSRTPQRICVHYDLIVAFVGGDPRGNAVVVRDALDYMQAQVTPDLDCRFCLQNLRAGFLGELDEFAEADAAIDKLFSICDDAGTGDRTATHHRIRGMGTRVWIDFQRGQWERMEAIAREGEILCREDGDQKSKLAEFIAWRAAIAAHAGRDAEALRLVRQVLRREADLVSPAGAATYVAAAECFEILQRPADALDVMNRQLARISGQGRWIHEARARLRKCRLLAELGRPNAAEIAATREVIQHMKEAGAAPLTTELAAIAVVDTEPENAG